MERRLKELDATLGKAELDVLVDLIRFLHGLDLDNTAIFIKVVDDRHAGLDKGSETLADARLIVVSSTAGLSAIDQTLLHDVLGAVKEQSEDALADRLLELNGLIHLTREAVNEEFVDALVLDGRLHCVLEQLDRHFHGHDLAVADVFFNQVAEVAAGAVLLFAQQVAGGQVLELVVADNVAALGAFACAGATQHENDNGLALSVAGGEERLVAGHGGDGRELGGCHGLVFGMCVGIEGLLGRRTLVSWWQDVVGFS